MGKMGIDEIGEGANWPLAVDGRCSDEWADAVIIQICNVCVGNCSNISNATFMWDIFQICNVCVQNCSNISNMQCLQEGICQIAKYVMFTWDIVQIQTLTPPP